MVLRLQHLPVDAQAALRLSLRTFEATDGSTSPAADQAAQALLGLQVRATMRGEEGRRRYCWGCPLPLGPSSPLVVASLLAYLPCCVQRSLPRSSLVPAAADTTSAEGHALGCCELCGRSEAWGAPAAAGASSGSDAAPAAAPPLAVCSRCKGAAYCCAAHQRLRWPLHKPHCTGTLQQAAAGGAASTA